MNCPSCHRENSSSNAYCGACGVALARVCANCDRENAPGDSFCGGCGQKLEKHVAAHAQGTAVREPQSYTPKHLAEKILTSRSALEGERKQVTVLFADLKGSMELSAGHDSGRMARNARPVLPDPYRRYSPSRRNS